MGKGGEEREGVASIDLRIPIDLSIVPFEEV